MTRDIDAVFEPKTAVYDEALAMAREKEWLDANWLNDAVKGFLHGPDPGTPQVVYSGKGISVQVASPRRLLAMKVAAARIERDSDDILTLTTLVGAGSIQEVLDIAYAEYGDLLDPRSRFVVEELLTGILPRSLSKPQ